MNDEVAARPTSDDELLGAIEEFRRANPGVAEAMRVFEIANEAYQASLSALYGPRIMCTSSANGYLTARR